MSWRPPLFFLLRGWTIECVLCPPHARRRRSSSPKIDGLVIFNADSEVCVLGAYSQLGYAVIMGFGDMEAARILKSV